MGVNVGDTAKGAATGAAVGSAIVPGVGTAIGAGIGGLGSLIGGWLGGNDAEEQRKLARGELDKGIGVLNDANVQAPNAWDGYTEAPEGREAQLGALRMMQGMGAEGGWDKASQAAFQTASNRSAQYEKAQRDAAMSQVAMSGGATSGKNLASRLAGVQTGANATATAGATFAGDARTRALDALKASGTLGTAVRYGDTSAATAKNNGTNYINTFNAAQRGQKARSIADMYASRAGTYDPAAAQKNATAMGSAAGTAVGSGVNALGKGMGWWNA